MERTSYTIILNKELREKLERKVKDGGFPTISNYLRYLINKDTEEAWNVRKGNKEATARRCKFVGLSAVRRWEEKSRRGE